VASVAHQPSQVNVTIIHENDPFGFHDWPCGFIVFLKPLCLNLYDIDLFVSWFPG
jgi:hypothetical protein